MESNIQTVLSFRYVAYPKCDNNYVILPLKNRETHKLGVIQIIAASKGRKNKQSVNTQIYHHFSDKDNGRL